MRDSAPRRGFSQWKASPIKWGRRGILTERSEVDGESRRKPAVTDRPDDPGAGSESPRRGRHCGGLGAPSLRWLPVESANAERDLLQRHDGALGNPIGQDPRPADTVRNDRGDPTGVVRQAS